MSLEVSVIANDVAEKQHPFADLCKLPVHFSPSKMSIISTPQGLKTIKDLCIVKETKKVFEIHLQKLHFGEFQEIQLFGIQNR